jgi:uncharacterized protein YciI
LRWVAIFEDHAGREWIRKEHSQAHFDYLASQSHKIRLAGGLRELPNALYCGGLWIMEVDSRDEAVRLVEADPCFTLGLRKSYRLLVWGKAPGYGMVSL